MKGDKNMLSLINKKIFLFIFFICLLLSISETTFSNNYNDSVINGNEHKKSNDVLPIINLEYSKVIVDHPNYDNRIKIDVQNKSNIKTAKLILSKEKKTEKINLDNFPYVFYVNPKEWGHGYIYANIEIETKAGNIIEKKARMFCVIDRDLPREKPDRHWPKLPSDKFAITDHKGNPISNEVKINENEYKNININLIQINNNQLSHKGQHILLKNYKQIPFKSNNKNKLVHNYSLEPGRFDFSNINFEMKKHDHIIFLSMTDFKKTFPGILIPGGQTESRIREVFNIKETEHTLPENINKIDHKKTVIDPDSTTNVIKPILITESNQKVRWAAKGKGGYGYGGNIDYFKPGDKYNFWVELSNSDKEKSKNIILFTLLNGQQVKAESGDVKGKVFLVEIEPHSFNHIPLKIILPEQKTEHTLTVITKELDSDSPWRIKNSKVMYLRPLIKTPLFTYDFNIDIDLNLKNNDIETEGKINMNGFLKIKGEQFYKETDVLSVDYKIKYEEINYTRNKGRFDLFIKNYQEKLENIEENYIAYFDSKKNLINTEVIDAPKGDLTSLLGLHKILIRNTLSKPFDLLNHEQNNDTTEIYSLFNRNFDNISVNKTVNKINEKENCYIKIEAVGEEIKEEKKSILQIDTGKTREYLDINKLTFWSIV